MTASSSSNLTNQVRKFAKILIRPKFFDGRIAHTISSSSRVPKKNQTRLRLYQVVVCVLVTAGVGAWYQATFLICGDGAHDAVGHWCGHCVRYLCRDFLWVVELDHES